MTLVLVVVAGALGATLRWLLDLAAAARLGRALPWGTIGANVLGSGIAGAIAGSTLASHLGAAGVEVLAVGLCGGFTTFSAASFDVARELEHRRAGLGAVLLFAPLALAVLVGAAAFGLTGG